MELKRILARDTRSATDKAIALYGPDVLVISNHQVDGQTELVVALDVPQTPEASASAPAPAFAPASTFASAPVAQVSAQAPAEAPAATNFRETFVQAQQPAARPSPTPVPAPVLVAQAIPAALLRPLPEAPAPAPAPAMAPYNALPPAEPNAAAQVAQDADAQMAQARDVQRSRELVDLVRQEIAALRREFRLSQQTSAWQQGLQVHPALSKLVEALNDSPVPAALRALLMDELKDQSDPHQVLDQWRAQLGHSLKRRQQDLPTTGVHVIAGPSGAGKSMMCARLARHASGLHGVEGVALISYRDQRAGAWSQIQMLGAQLGVDCFRANDAQALGMLLDELGSRRLVMIDTPGVQMNERLAELRTAAPKAQMHALVPADASVVTLRKVLLEAGQRWTSVMLSKLDETHAPWPLLQLFSDNDLELSGASDGSQVSNLMKTFTVPQLIDLALAPLARAVEFSGAPRPAVASAAAVTEAVSVPPAKPKAVRRTSRSTKASATAAVSA